MSTVELLKGVTKKWLAIMTKDNMYRDLQNILTVVEQDKFNPAAQDIFNFARFSFDNIKVVVLGMDPYPNVGDAHGLSFSSLSEKCPTSLNRIYCNLIHENLLTHKPDSFDLSYLAMQGFVLLNTALTVRQQCPGSHIRHWSTWTDQLIKNLSQEAPTGTIWCLWGADAQKKQSLIDAKKHCILTHCHPVAMVSPSFSDCTHFRTIATRYPNIIWDPTATETHFFTDCSARGNQFKDCKASYGVVCTKGLLKNKTWGAETLPREIPYRGKMETARPTNIRGEGEALIKALELSRSLWMCKVRIYSDSKFWIVDMLEKYIPDWVSRGADFSNKKNSDLVKQFWTLSQQLSGKVEFQFVNAWHDRDRPADGTDDLYYWLGNQSAERAAEAALGL